MKVLIAVDGSDCSIKAAEYVKRHGNVFGADTRLTLVNVQIGLPPHIAARVPKGNVKGYYADGHESDMKPIRRILNDGKLSYEEVLIEGHPGDEIAKLAKSGKFDMVVMGSHGRGLLKTVVLGSVATKVLASCSVPVLIIR